MDGNFWTAGLWDRPAQFENRALAAMSDVLEVLDGWSSEAPGMVRELLTWEAAGRLDLRGKSTGGSEFLVNRYM